MTMVSSFPWSSTFLKYFMWILLRSYCPFIPYVFAMHNTIQGSPIQVLTRPDPDQLPESDEIGMFRVV